MVRLSQGQAESFKGYHYNPLMDALHNNNNNNNNNNNYYYYYLLIRVFHISVSWWSFTGDWVTASFLKSPGFFTESWPFLIMLLFRWSPFGRRLPNPPGPLIILLLPCQTHQSQLAYLSPSCSIVFFNSLARSRYLSLFSHSFSFILWSAWAAKSTILQISFFCWLFWPRLGYLFVCLSPIEVSVCHFLGQELGWAYTMYWHGQI